MHYRQYTIQYKCNIASIVYYSILALTHKICRILSKKLQKLALLKLFMELICQNNRILLFF